MIVIKFINLFLIVVVSSYIGIYKSKIFGKRVIELKKFKSSLEVFRSKVEFTYEPIKDIFMDISKMVYEDNENIFGSFCENLGSKDISYAWEEAVEKTVSNLNKEDKEVISMLGKLLGKTDKSGQINEINMVSSFLDKQIAESEEDKRKNEKLYRTLGSIAGLAIAIILI